MGIGGAISAVGSIAGMMGGSEETGSAGGSSSQMLNGYYAAPPEQQKIYDSLYAAINKLYGNALPRATQYSTVGAPQTPFDSQELYNLQQANPNTKVNPIGITEGFNQYQKNALSAYGTPDFSAGAMAQYQNPFNQQVRNTTLAEIDRKGAMDQSGLMDQHSRLNSRAMGSSLGTQLAQNTDNTNRMRAAADANLGYQGYNESLALRDQSLRDQLSSGTLIQDLNQQRLAAASPTAAYQADPTYLQTSLLGPLFGYLPTNSQSTSESTGSSINENSRQASPMSRVGAGVSSLFGKGGGLSGLFG